MIPDFYAFCNSWNYQKTQDDFITIANNHADAPVAKFRIILLFSEYSKVFPINYKRKS